MPILNVQRIFEIFKKENVRYILVGGMAAIGHGMNYLTDDLDVCYDRQGDNLISLVKALIPSKPRLRTPHGDVDFIFDERTLKNGLNFTLQTDLGPIDLLGEIQGIGGYRELLPRAERFEFYGISVDTISLADLIHAKQLAGREKDKIHLRQLHAIQDKLEKKW